MTLPEDWNIWVSGCSGRIYADHTIDLLMMLVEKIRAFYHDEGPAMQVILDQISKQGRSLTGPNGCFDFVFI